MKIKELLDLHLIESLDEYSQPGVQSGSAIKEVISKIETSEMIIPVLGTQGMGKSTLINAILKEDILPNNADETTCVPVEVKFGKEECAEILFTDDKPSLKVHTREELNNYVDNNYNPANQKRVANIILYRNLDLLSNGLVIVDLPGVGSLTKENENTANRYIEDICTAIFMIPTVPTIRRSESIFIKGAWSQFFNAIFVQNDFGETPIEIKESLDFNSKKLKQIANELNTPFDEDILVVNAYKGIAGAISNDNEMLKESNIDSLIHKIKFLSEDWEKERMKALKSRFLAILSSSIQMVQQKIDDLNKSDREIKDRREAEYLSYCEGTKNIFSKISEVKLFLNDIEDNTSAKIRKDARICAGDIRSEVYNVIEGGVFDGQQLMDAFNHIQEDKCQDFFDTTFDHLMEVKYEFETHIKDLVNVVELENNFDFETVSHDTEKKLKYEKTFGPVIELGGGLGSIWAFSLGGPLGWGVAIGVLIVSAFIKSKSIKTVQNNRVKKAKKEITNVLEVVERTLRNSTQNKVEEFIENSERALQALLSQRRNQERALKKDLDKRSEASNSKKLHEDLRFLQSKEKEAEHV